jgi:hypothetical protein
MPMDGGGPTGDCAWLSDTVLVYERKIDKMGLFSLL